MSFREKSAWVMGAIMLATGVFYAQLVAGAPQAPVIGPLIPYVLAVVVFSIVAQVGLAIASPKEANAPADERERSAIDRAGNWSGMVLGFGVVSAIIMYIGGWTATLMDEPSRAGRGGGGDAPHDHRDRTGALFPQPGDRLPHRASVRRGAGGRVRLGGGVTFHLPARPELVEGLSFF